jgi:hypothetical protein
MIRFVLGLGVAVLVVVLFARFVGSVPTAGDLLPAQPQTPAVETPASCKTSKGRDVVRVFDDRVEVVRCGGDR